MSSRRVRIHVRGRVQGVAYRASTERKARALGLTGWVKNEPDGSVLLEAQGPAEVVARLEAWCKDGPALAVVKALDTTELPVVAGERDFEIRYD